MGWVGTDSIRSYFSFIHKILFHKISVDLILNSPNLTAHVWKSSLSSSSVQSAKKDLKVVVSENISLLENFCHVDSLYH